MKFRLRTKFAILFISTALLPLLVGMTITAITLQNIERGNALNLNQQYAQNVSEQVKAFVEAQFGILEHISIDPQLFDKKNQTTLLERALFKSNNFIDISILDGQGRTIRRENVIRLVTDKEMADRAASPEFQAVKSQKRYLGSVYLSEGKPYFQIGVPAFDSGGKFIGAVFGIVDARVMQEVVKNISETSKVSRVYIIDERNIVIAHPDISDVLLQKDFSSIDIIHSIRNLAPKDINEVRTYRNELKQEVFAIGIPVDLTFQYQQKDVFKTDWMVISEQPVSVVLKSVRQVSIFTAELTLLILLVAIAATFIFTNKIVGPVEKLHKASQEIAQGNLDYRVSVATGDEIEDLAIQFNSMVALIKNQIEELKKTDKLKDEFISLVSHNLRTPLTVIKGYLFVFRNEKIITDNKGLDYLFKLDENVKSLDRLVSEMLYISSVGIGGMKIDAEPFNIAQSIKDVIAAIDILIKQRDIKVTLDYSPDLPLVTANKNRINDVIVNLLDNAIKFSPRGGSIEFNTRVEGDNLVTSITDHGIGIDETVLPTLFEKFHRGTDYLMYNYPGTGLGIYYCKIVIESHHGKIWVESKKGVGSTFFFSLPIFHKELDFKTPD